MRQYWRARGVMFYLNPLNNRAGNLEESRFVQLLPFSEGANREQLMQLNMSGCPSLHSFMGILWNGDVVRCCNDWRRARVMGNAGEHILKEIWENANYRWMRSMSEAGRLNEVELCGDCGDGQFHIDLPALRRFLEARRGDAASADDLAVVAELERVRARETECLQLGLVR